MEANDYPVRLKAQPLPLFETPLGFGELADADSLLDELGQAIAQRRSIDAGLKRSNEGGWHSTTDMLDWGGAAARKLADLAIGVAKRMSHFEGASAADFDWQVSMWANVTQPGGLNALHAHPGNLWAAVLYLDMGDEQPGESCGGNFYLEDPRFPLAAMHHTGFRLLGGDGRPQQYQLELKLQRGNLIVFPAWLRHGVRAYTGSRERVSVAMNIDAQARR